MITLKIATNQSEEKENYRKLMTFFYMYSLVINRSIVAELQYHCSVLVKFAVYNLYEQVLLVKARILMD